MVHQTMKTSNASAPSASSNSSNMRRIVAVFGVALLAACGTAGLTPERDPASLSAAGPELPRPAPPSTVLQREAAVWRAARWDELPGWEADALQQVWPALLAGCARPAAGWQSSCASARALDKPDARRVRVWLEQQLLPWRIESAAGRGDVRPEGLLTGYFEPQVRASRWRSTAFAVPLHTPPAGLALRKPWYSRSEIEQLPAAQAALRGHEIAWLADPLELLMLQIQGSGRLRLTEPDGSIRSVRVAYAGSNDQPYRSVGRWLVERGALTLEQASWPAIRAWARANPGQVPELLAANPRYVFFRETPLPDPTLGPTGAQGVALTPGRSIAVDPRAVPYGTPVWIDSTEPQPWSPTPPPRRPLQRLVMAQDTGSAITGAPRADYFWGWGEGAEDSAGRMKQPLRMWALWPRDSTPPR